MTRNEVDPSADFLANSEERVVEGSSETTFQSPIFERVSTLYPFTSPAGAFHVITIVDLELSFQFPIKRDGASPVAVVAGVEAAADAVVAASGVGDSDAIAEALAEALGAGAAASSFLFPFEITIAPSATTPTSTARSTLADEPWRGAADAVGAGFAAAGFGAATGVVETLTRALPVEGTGGTTTLAATFFADADLDVDLLTAFFTVFLAAFLATAFFVTAFLATLFFDTAFFATAFLVVAFLATFLATFLGAAFFAADFFFTATVYLLVLVTHKKLL